MEPITWGLNPSTFQAAGAIASTFALGFLAWNVWHVRKQTSLQEREFNARARAWLSMRRFSLESHLTQGTLNVVFGIDNMGESPATDVKVSFELTNPPGKGNIYSTSFGVLFARGTGDHAFPLPDYLRSDDGRLASDVAFNIIVRYTTLEASRSTTCTATITLEGGVAQIEHRNVAVT